MKNKKAFTLMELLTVIAVMAVLAGLLLPALNRARARARTAAAESMIASLQVALSMYNMDYGMYPASSATGIQRNGNSFHTDFDGAPNNLVAALTAPTLGGPYMELRGSDLDTEPTYDLSRRNVVLDPWGRAYVYTARRDSAGDPVGSSYGPFHPHEDPLDNTYNIYSLGPNGLTSDDAGNDVEFTGNDWHVAALVSNEAAGDWSETDDSADPHYDDINSWDGSRR